MDNYRNLRLPCILELHLSQFFFFNLTLDWFCGIIKDKPICERGVAQPGSALEWGSRGRWFESSRPDFQRSHVSASWLKTGVERLP